MFQRIGPAAFKKDLSNIQKASEYLGNPHLKFKSIHIAGTNGKGSTAHMLAAVFTAAGYKTGLYTSPHYRDFRERIKIDGNLIPKKKVIQFVRQQRPFFEQSKVSFFEWTVALAFDYFAEESVDIAIIETGLGGRLDSTNIVKPLLSVITNIGLDHVSMLGDTLPLIAAEKAGIIKETVPVVIGETHPETALVFKRKSEKEAAPIYFADQLLQAKSLGVIDQSVDYEVQSMTKEPFNIHVRLAHLGAYQRHNLITCIQAIRLIDRLYSNHFNRLIDSISKGLSNLKSLTNFIGRWEFISQDPAILVDSAHNEAGIRQLVKAFEGMSFTKIHFVLGVVADKDHGKTFSLLPKDADYYFAKANIPRGMDAKQLEKIASEYQLYGKSYQSIRRALAAAKKRVNPNELIFVGGSIFTVAEVI